MKSGEHFDVIIVGGGAAGLSCALFLVRAQLRVALFDNKQSSLRRVERVNNYLGFPHGIRGGELLDLGHAQALRFGVKMFDEEIATVRKIDSGFAIDAGDSIHTCRSFVLASNKRTDLAVQLGLQLGGFGSRFISVDSDGQTAVADCYAIGRIAGLPSQAIISAGHGAHVAIALIQKVRGTYYVDHDT
jgi:thioredoxin reductase (NADPH)